MRLTIPSIILLLAGSLMVWFSGWFAAASSTVVTPRSNDAKTERLFKKLGVIPMAGIAPPSDLALKDLNGRTVRISDFKGKIVFLNFWTTWCNDCKIEMPVLEKLHRNLKDRNFVILAVDLRESAATVKAFFKAHKLTFTALLDTTGRIGLQFGIRSIPTTFILNKKGGMIGKVPGPRQWDGKYAKELFEHLMQQV